MSLTQQLMRHLPRPLSNWKEKRYYGLYGEIELHLVKYLCDKRRDAIDVGGNDGCYVHFMLPHAGRVIAFEPFPYFIGILNRKFRGKAVIEAMALGAVTGEATLRIPIMDGEDITGCSTIDEHAATYYPAFREIKVPVDRLDNCYKGDVGFIKIDVEGHEYAVLEGARDTIKRCRPRVMVELVEHLGDGCIAKTKRFFDRLGYQGFFVYNGTLRPIGQFDVGMMQSLTNMPDLHASLKDRPKHAKYIYNFIFIPMSDHPAIIHAMNDRLRRL